MPKGIQRNIYILFFLIVGVSATAQINLDADGGPFTYSQNFNAVYPADPSDQDSGDDNTWANNLTLPGWYAAMSEGPAYFDEYRITNGSQTSGSRLYSYGPEKDDINATDRALGFQTSGSSEDVALAVLFQNTGSLEIQSISIHVTGEQWRRSGGCTKGQQRMKISYLVDNGIDAVLNNINPTVGAGLTMGDGFTELFEGVLVNKDTTSLSGPLQGNDLINQAVLSLTFPVSVPAGQQLLLRFYDEELSCGNQDPPIALDDLTLTFSTSPGNTVFNPDVYSGLASTNITIAEYLSQGITKDILENPDDKPEIGFPVYVAPTPAEYADWTTILTDFFVEHDFVEVASAVSGHGYELITFPKPGDADNPFRVLRRNPGSTNYWGTLVVNPGAGLPGNQLNIQAPHAANDSNTGVQGASVLMHTNAYSLCIAGADRCFNDVSTGCSGGGKCNNGSGNYHSTADLAHDSHNLMDLSMRIIADNQAASKFVQLHGFGSGRDFDFVLSNGTEHEPADPSKDFAFQLATELRAIDPANIYEKTEAFDVRVPHKGDEIDELRGFTNNQGKWLNNINNSDFDPCLDGDASSANGRFIHLEQYGDIRNREEMHILLSGALMGALDIILPVTLISISAEYDEAEGVILSWQVGQETNHSHYEVEKSTDGIHFDHISNVVETKCLDPIWYEFTDRAPVPRAYYRIRQVDIDGGFAYFPTQFLNIHTIGRRPDIFPNPASHSVTITETIPPGALLNLGGDAVPASYHNTAQGHTVIDLTSLPDGIYLLNVQGRNYKVLKAR